MAPPWSGQGGAMPSASRPDIPIVVQHRPADLQTLASRLLFLLMWESGVLPASPQARFLRPVHSEGRGSIVTVQKHSTVVGVFQDRSAAQKALAELRRQGFREDQLGVVA